jgi:hypothetical protein
LNQKRERLKKSEKIILISPRGLSKANLKKLKLRREEACMLMSIQANLVHRLNDLFSHL